MKIVFIILILLAGCGPVLDLAGVNKPPLHAGIREGSDVLVYDKIKGVVIKNHYKVGCVGFCVLLDLRYTVLTESGGISTYQPNVITKL